MRMFGRLLDPRALKPPTHQIERRFPDFKTISRSGIQSTGPTIAGLSLRAGSSHPLYERSQRLAPKEVEVAA
jgi:hypothetical protein